MAIPYYQLPVDLRDQLTVVQAMCNYQPMVETQELREAFVARLNHALNLMPGVRNSRGRNVDLYEGIHNHPSAKASKQATHKWLSGESMPGRGNMIAIAEWLGVRLEWLAHGEGEMRQGAKPAEASEARGEMLTEIRKPQARNYQRDLYETAPQEQREAVDELADKLLRLKPEQARKLKQAMELLMPDNGTAKD